MQICFRRTVMLNTLAWQHVNRRIGARWSGELRIEKIHLQRSSLSADLRPQRSASTSERGWLPQPRSHAVARTPYSSPHFGPSRRSDLSQNGYGHLVVLFHLIVFFLSFCFAISRHLVVPFFIASLFLFFHYVLHFHRYIFRTHAALRAILAFQIFSVHFVFLHGYHAF